MEQDPHNTSVHTITSQLATHQRESLRSTWPGKRLRTHQLSRVMFVDDISLPDAIYTPIGFETHNADYNCGLGNQKGLLMIDGVYKLQPQAITDVQMTMDMGVEPLDDFTSFSVGKRSRLAEDGSINLPKKK